MYSIFHKKGAIFNKAEQSQKEQEQTINEAFKDMDGLIANLNEVVWESFI